MLPRFMIRIYRGRYAVDVTPPFHTRLVYRQQFLFTPAIVAFCRSVLATMVRNWMQTVVILLKQYSAGCIFARVGIHNERFREVWEL